MSIKFYNTYSRSLEEFHTLRDDEVRMYTCGPTVYNYPHIGNMRPPVVFDVLFRLLRETYGADHVIYARNYGEAAALDFFGARYGLPKTVCAHNSYWYWGTGVEPMRVAIIFGAYPDADASLADLRRYFDTATLAATTACVHCMPYENHRAIVLCRGPHFRFHDIWAKERSFI